MVYSKAESKFILINSVSIISLFLLIFAGGIVRSTGSGMGCPDWPKCFDQYIPPTEINQLPKDYKSKYVEQRLRKNEKFARILEKLGYSDLANKVRNDESIKVPEEFNVSKTYTEYINRLIGAVVGLILLFKAWLSKIYIKTKPRIFYMSIVNLFLVLFQAWMGSIVVATNLLQWVITLHVLLALVIVGITIYTYFEAKAKEEIFIKNIKIYNLLKPFALFSLILIVNQIAIGTSVREEIDAVFDRFPNLDRNLWVTKISDIHNYHKDIALLVLIINLLMVFFINKSVHNFSAFRKVIFTLITITFLQMFIGVTLSYFSLPPSSQALHILFASLLFASQFYLVLKIVRSSTYIQQAA